MILTGLIERFWTMEEEDGTANSLSVLASTFFIAGCVWLLATIPAMPAWMMRHPETLLSIMAGQLLLGRYTGYRLLELYRFRSMAEGPRQPFALPRLVRTIHHRDTEAQRNSVRVTVSDDFLNNERRT